MNELHLQICSSPEWADFLEKQLLPWVLDAVDLGGDVLEIGPGPGLTTDILRRQVERLTAVEIDPDLAAALSGRLQDTNVTVVRADAAALPMPDGTFSAAASSNMLHHVPSLDLQAKLLTEAYRTLRPGGVFIGTDTVDTEPLRACHIDDTFVPVDPVVLRDLLKDSGFADVRVECVEERFRFLARK